MGARVGRNRFLIMGEGWTLASVGFANSTLNAWGEGWQEAPLLLENLARVLIRAVRLGPDLEPADLTLGAVARAGHLAGRLARAAAGVGGVRDRPEFQAALASAAARALAPLVGVSVTIWINLRASFIATALVFFTVGILAILRLPKGKN